jgi:hypothetical protein
LPLAPQFDVDVSAKNQCDLELAMYRSQSVLGQKEDPLEWWKRKRFQMPALAAVARTILSIPATSALLSVFSPMLDLWPPN